MTDYTNNMTEMSSEKSETQTVTIKLKEYKQLHRAKAENKIRLSEGTVQELLSQNTKLTDAKLAEGERNRGASPEAWSLKDISSIGRGKQAQSKSVQETNMSDWPKGPVALFHQRLSPYTENISDPATIMKTVVDKKTKFEQHAAYWHPSEVVNRVLNTVRRDFGMGVEIKFIKGVNNPADAPSRNRVPSEEDIQLQQKWLEMLPDVAQY